MKFQVKVNGQTKLFGQSRQIGIVVTYKSGIAVANTLGMVGVGLKKLIH